MSAETNAAANAEAAQIVRAAKDRRVPIDPRFYARQSSTVPTGYHLNALECQTRFAIWLDDAAGRPVDVAEMMAVHRQMHKVAALGESGERPYVDTCEEMLDMYEPGELRDGSFANRLSGQRPGAPAYARAVLEELGLSPPLSDGPVPIPGVPQSKESSFNSRNGKVHLYPAGGEDNLRPYFERAAAILAALPAPPGPDSTPGPAVVEQIGQYYYALINAKPFVQINNSILMAEVNVLLARHGFPPVAHGWIDHIAYRTDPDTFGRTMLAHVQGRLRSPAAYGLEKLMR